MKVVAPSLWEAALWAAIGGITALAIIYTVPRLSKQASSAETSQKQRQISTNSAISAAIQEPDAEKEVDADKAEDAKNAKNTPVKASFKDKYALGKRLGSGSYAVVREGVNISTGEKFAIKCIQKSSLSEDDQRYLQDEIKILQGLNHPNIMRLYEVFTEEEYIYMVTEYVAGGELFDRIVDKGFYSEKEARDLIRLFLQAIKYCHDRNVVHRDLKPENLLLSSVDDDASIKIADFGFAKQNWNDESGGLTTTCGSPGYVAPEILQGHPYGKAVDVWSIGVITYILMCGYPPFHDENQRRLFMVIKSGKYRYDSPYWDEVSDLAKQFISKMLRVDPAERLTVDELLADPWVTGEVSTAPLNSAMQELKKYNNRRRFKAAVRTVQATAALTRGLAK